MTHYSSRDWRNDDGVWNWHRMQAEWGQTAQAEIRRAKPRPSRPTEGSLVRALGAHADRAAAAAKAERKRVQAGENRAEELKLQKLIEVATADPPVRFESLLSRLKREAPQLIEEPREIRECSDLPEPHLRWEDTDPAGDLSDEYTF
jgi:hypothetical protein